MKKKRWLILSTNLIITTLITSLGGPRLVRLYPSLKKRKKKKFKNAKERNGRKNRKQNAYKHKTLTLSFSQSLGSHGFILLADALAAAVVVSTARWTALCSTNDTALLLDAWTPAAVLPAPTTLRLRCPPARCPAAALLPLSSSCCPAAAAGLLKMKQEDVSCCQIQEWYPKFKSFSIKTAIVQLPESFIQYLVGDSGPFLLPTSVSNEDAFPKRIHNPEEEEDYQVAEGFEDESEQSPPPPSFPELELKIKESIELLGGAVFPKLNWSSPKDSAWISPTGTLKCTSFSDIALLLKSSDSVVHDLCHAYDSCSDKTLSRPHHFHLALRKWYPSLRPEMEFRCFVRSQQLVGISQREVTAYYPAVLESKDNLKDLIHDFFLDNIEGRFKSENYTFDVYVTKDRRVKLIDFNPWGAFTLPLLFTWEELEQNGRLEEDVDFRIVESQHTVRPGLKTAVPYDYIDMSPGSGWDQFLRNADEELQQQMRSSEAGA